METRKRLDSGRDLLEELEDGWGTPSAPAVKTPELIAAEKAVAAKANDDLDALDDGWLDQFFPEEEEDEEEEQPEPDLPDERLDPVAYAKAKKEREERQAAKKDKKKQKLDAKRKRQKARVQAMRQKQKGKKARAEGAPKSERAPKSRRAAKNEKASKAPKPKPNFDTPADTEGVEATSEPSADEIPDVPAAKKSVKKKGGLNAKQLASIKLLAVVLGVLVALAALAAALMK